MPKGPNTAGEGFSDQEPLLVQVGSRIRATRQRAKLKQSELAAAIGTKQSYIVGMESGDTNITLRTLARVAAALGVAPVALLMEEGPDAATAASASGQLGKLLSAAMQDTDRVADFLRRAHVLVAGKADKAGPDVPT